MNKSFLKYIALYLPQFHTFPENDEWWGKGFTEWTNSSKAKPFFDGHYQPHEPVDEVGYYDLANVDVMVNQAKMAKEYGIYGFCYYYYWFNGRKLMEKPLQNMLNNPAVDIPFCLCWANHNWTRRWDGMDQEMLLEQTYDESTYTRFIDDLAPYFQDSRYIRINDKPVLLIYQADHVKNPSEAVLTWRAHAKEQYGIELYLICVQQSANVNPYALGYDAAVDFTPTWRAEDIIPKEKCPKLYDENNKALFFDYKKNVLTTIFRNREPYKLFKCVYPMWDNSARRKDKGANIILNSSPENFKQFLLETSKLTCEELPKDERLLFINAWNEWAEGTHLEPCKKYGYKLLEICREMAGYSEEDLLAQGIDGETRKWILNQISQSQYNNYQINELNQHINKTSYDLILSIGEDCASTSYLRRLGIQTASYPFDWLTKAPFENRVELLVNNFKNFMKKDFFKLLHKDPAIFGHTDEKYDYYEHVENKFYFYHDFTHGKSLDEVFPEVEKKYNRRIKRLYNDINKSKKVLFVWLSRNKELAASDLTGAMEKLKKRFPKKDINLLILENDKNAVSGNVKYRSLDQNITQVKYDNASYDRSNPLAECMGNIAASDLILSQLIQLKKDNISVKKRVLLKAGNLLCLFIPNSSKRRNCREKITQKVMSS